MMNLQEKNIDRAKAAARHALQKLNLTLASVPECGEIDIVAPGSDEPIRLSRDVAELLCEILVNTAAGRKVKVIALNAELTTQQAADLLNVSRPHVIKLMDEGILKGHKVGTHRRLYASSVQEFKRQRDLEQRAAADELAALSEEMGLYE
ncbi:helix-turn-helix domain-containing protein [Corynebacterium macginleyi]|uniref:helix-turn-helix domain-containing protein n=1 Tax=Corynebacterium macginleyi TaxID=38290 RepID=UPI00190E4C60|nr:helix-turn-helix domain-containing protein [Corynebacterium macginleyi]MBK4163373.1 excisionase family DNA-binding protein [Corynebacterium macginleyi]